MAKGNEVISPNLGLYLGQPAISIPPRGLQDGFNFRIRQGKLNNLNLGWVPFGTFTLNGPVLLIDDFLPVSQGLPSQLLFATKNDIYLYKPNTDTVVYLTPRYEVGTASVGIGLTTVTGSGTAWANALLHIRAGDELSFGTAGQTATTALWLPIASVTDNLHLELASGSPISAPPQAYTIRRKFSGGDGTQWDTAVYVRDPSGVDTWWATNGVDNIVTWDGVATQVKDEFGGLVMGFKAKQLFVFANMMIFGNINQGGSVKGTDIINSDVGNPANVATGLFGQFKVHSGSDEILTMDQLGDNLVIYSRDHVVFVQFQGAPVVFAFRTMGQHVGPVASGAVANFGDYHEFVGRDSQYIFDGVNITEISQHVWREVLRTQDPLRVGRTYNHFDIENGEVLWVVPLTTDPNSGTATAPPAKAYVEHYLEQLPPNTPRAYSARSFPFLSSGFYLKQSVLTWDQMGAWNTLNFRWNDQFFFQAFPFSLVGDAAGKVFSLNFSQDANGAALSSFVKFPRRPTGGSRGLVARVYPWATTFTTPMLVSVLMSDNVATVPTIFDTQTLDQSGTDPQQKFTVHYRRGWYVDVGFSSTGPSQPWEISGYNIDIRPGGKR